MRLAAWASLIGYGAALIGFLGGALCAVKPAKAGGKWLACLLGASAGLLIAFICFEMLPVVFTRWGLYPGVVVLVTGAVFAALMEGYVSRWPASRKSPDSARFLKNGLLLTAGVMLHNFPEGAALGAMLRYNLHAGLSMALVIALHALPEGIMVMVPLGRAGMSTGKRFLLCFIMALPMALGAVPGYWLGGISTVFVDICLSFAGGVMLYITCGEVLPDAQSAWPGRLAALGAAVGFAAGVLLTAVH